MGGGGNEPPGPVVKATNLMACFLMSSISGAGYRGFGMTVRQMSSQAKAACYSGRKSRTVVCEPEIKGQERWTLGGGTAVSMLHVPNSCKYLAI